MVRASLKRALLSVLLVATVSCLNVELLAPTTRRTLARGGVQLADADTLQLEIDFMIDPGTDAATRALRTPNRMLRVEGQSLQPVDSSSGVLTYRSVITLPGAVRDRQAVTFTFPDIPDANAAQFDVNVPILSRIGPHRIALAPNTDLVLQSRPPAALPPGASPGWLLELGITCGSGIFARITGTGVPPASITIPAALLAAVAPATFETCLLLSWVGTFNEGSYPVNLQSLTQVVWEVTRS